MNSYLSALVGLTVTWMVISLASLATFDPTNGFSPITLTFLGILGVFTVIESVRYSRALKKQKTKADMQQDSEY
ncbi:MAG: hypothetical protein AAFO72_01480 [Pseudomonadota bacterium]